MMESNPSQDVTPNPEEETRLLYKNWREKFAMPLLISSLMVGAFVLIPAVQSAKPNYQSGLYCDLHHNWHCYRFALFVLHTYRRFSSCHLCTWLE